MVVNVVTLYFYYDVVGNVFNMGIFIVDKGKIKYVIFKIFVIVLGRLFWDIVKYRFEGWFFLKSFDFS